MGTLNADLLSKDMDAVMNEAALIRREYRQQSIQPEVILLALLRSKETAASRIFKVFEDTRGVELDKLERQTELAAKSRRDRNGDLDFLANGNKKVALSRQIVIMLDEALSVANAAHEVHIDTEHILTVLAESQMSSSGILRQAGITPKAIKDITGDSSEVQSVKSHGTVRDYKKMAERGNLHAVYFREDLLREMISVLSQSINRHIILIGPDGVGKRTLAYSLALLMAEGKVPSLQSLVQIDEKALLDNEQNAVRAGLSKANDGILFIPHIHRFFGGPIKAEFSKSTALIQKAFLEDNPVIITTTTEAEYKQRIDGVSAITENSQIIRVEATDAEETTEILKVAKPHIEADYGITIDEEALKLTANLARRYLAEIPAPRSAEHLLHRTAAMVSIATQDNQAFPSILESDGLLDAVDVLAALSEMTGIPTSKLGEDERERYATMDDHIKQHIIGQDEAVRVVSRAIK
ncbi:MAG: Clp protease N-terminal domain-containing protein, partial [Aggregatilineales bacterium]